MVCGAPGSGTSLATKILRYSGMFAGADAGPIDARKFHESVVFRNANNQVLESTIGFPHAPKTIAQFSTHVKRLEDQIDKLIVDVDLKDLLQVYWGDQTEHQLWGWKDPRNSANALLWRKVFPKLRVVIVEKKWRWSERRKQGSLAGTWFRAKSNKPLRDLYVNPPYIDGLDCFRFNIDQFMRDAEHLGDLWKWLELDEGLFRDFKEFKTLVNAEDKDV